MPNLFVLVSTKQKVANLPPVLEHAQRGDFVLWVESKEARTGNWTAAPLAVLEDRGLVTVEVIPVEHVNDPFSVAAALAPFAKNAIGQYECVFLVGNGGTKYSPIGLMFGLESLHPQHLYGDVEPAVHSVYPHGLDSPPEPRGYGNNTLTLHEILRLTGHLINNAGEASQIWPEPHTLPTVCQQELYGQDASYTAQLHAAHHAWAAIRPVEERMPFADLRTLVPQQYEKWSRSIQATQRNMNTQNLEGLYNSSLKLEETARLAIGKLRSQLPKPVAPIGVSLERATARRVRDWLGSFNHSAVQSVWFDVKVARESTPHKEEVQFDVLLVLKNGILLHLECKSADIDIRDMDVRIHRLQQAGSQLAKLAIVLPIYTSQAHTPWFANLHDTWERAKQARLTVLPFTLEGQSERYLVPDSDPSREAECHSFETELRTLLRDYKPPPGRE